MNVDVKSAIGGIFVGGVFVAALTFAFGGYAPKDGKRAKSQVTGPGGLSYSTESEGRDDYATLLSKMFGDPTVKPQAVAWLESHAELFAATSDNLADAVARKSCPKFSDEVTAETLKAKRECAEKVGVRRFRDLASQHRAPFHYVGSLGKLGVPGNVANKPALGMANACRPGEFHGKRLQVASPDGNQVIEIIASGAYPCTGAIPTPDIQLSGEDAVKLFPNHPLAKTEEVLIVPLD